MYIPSIEVKDGHHYTFYEDYLFLRKFEWDNAPEKHDRWAANLKWKYIRHHIWLFKSWSDKEKIDGICRFLSKVKT